MVVFLVGIHLGGMEVAILPAVVVNRNVTKCQLSGHLLALCAPYGAF